MLAEGLPLGAYKAKIWMEQTVPNRSAARRPPPPGIQGDLKLWLSYYLVMGGTWADQSQTIAASPHPTSLAADPAPNRCSTTVVAPLKHEDDLIRRQQGVAGKAFHSQETHNVVLSDEDVLVEECASCGTRGAELSLLRCSRCKITYYCGNSCQRNHWPAHRGECHAASS